ncbi:MAG: hypothetical protein JW843_09170 [Candidatus Aminicenantes bacterium]|nr:hypothetical protein [Candidatus Aminicenantes bacterium]
MEKMNDGEVVILVDWEKGVLSDERKRLKVPNEGAEKDSFVTWKWAGGDEDGLFFILFPEASPFMEREFASQHGVVRQKVAYDPRHGGARRFKYIIAGYRKENGLHVLDPEIIIPRPVGESGK